jgi:RNA polymerase subunit RPABC4/transcription elongation factor Spt4
MESRQVCQRCRSLIDAHATTCPECGRTPFPSPWFMPLTYIAVGFLVLVFAVWFLSRV